MQHSISRRTVLKSGGVAALATLAGCRVGADSTTANPQATTPAEPTAPSSPTAAPEPTPVPPTPAPPTPVPAPTASPVSQPTPTEVVASPGTPVRIASNVRNNAPEDALINSLAGFDGPEPDIEFLDTFEYQDLIGRHLEDDFDILAWFSGYRNRQFAEDGLVLDVSEVWDRSSGLLPAARAAATGYDGKQYLVPVSFYTWAMNYSVPVFESNGWVPPTSLDEMLSLADDMSTAGITPFALANDGQWPAMGTFDVLNMRVNGYQFHRDVLAGRASFVDGRVKDVFTQWELLLPYQQENPNGRTWQEACTDLADGRAGMVMMGTFAASADDRLVDDMDFFTFPEIDPAVGAGAIDAPVDGYQLSARSAAPDEAKNVLAHLASPTSQRVAAISDNSVVYANVDGQPPALRQANGMDRIRRRSLQLATESDQMASFLDRETTPEFAGACGDVLAEFLANPNSIDAGLERLEELSVDLL